ncbi:GHMP family kinase ATP-binding protein [Palleronia sediminis]|nr:propanediol utilization protein [Palleronia sediminis]
MPLSAPRRLRVPGHFGELLQGRLGPAGPVVLVTLPCAALGTTIHGRAARRLAIHDPARVLGPGAARRLLAGLGARPVHAALRSDLPPGGGAGASTAALVALARFAAPDARPERIARAALAIEGATDPLMFDAPERLLWASRMGAVVARRDAMPPLDVVGALFGPPCRTDPLDDAFPDISDLVPEWRAARDAAALAAVASESARRTLALRGPADDPAPALAARLGALGFAIAHTGPARALVFAPGTVPPGAAATLRAAGGRGVLRFRAGGGR